MIYNSQFLGRPLWRLIKRTNTAFPAHYNLNMKLYASEQLLKKYAGKFINTYPHHYDKKDEQGNWITTYEVRGVSDKIRENYNLPEDCLIK